MQSESEGNTNSTVILEEEIDEDYEPTQEGKKFE